MPKQLNSIIPHLYLADSTSSCDEELVRERAIKGIVNLCHPGDSRASHRPLEARLNVVYHCGEKFSVDGVPRRDTRLSPMLPSALKFMHERLQSRQNVLVYDKQGRSLSAALVIGYLVQHCSMSLHDAYLHVKKRRPSVQPSQRFLGELRKLEKAVRGQYSIDGPTLRWPDFDSNISCVFFGSDLPSKT
jgi:hypothetical protein